ncbi:MAG: PilZ domain-containing protein [Candidatus Eremiobacteraeota bacterium]|nr:PilZ domain-containing protein [Candidatus Eremiobacteraeota bacterium]
MTDDEKRKAPRLQFVDVTYVSDSEGTIKGSVHDISLTGIRFCSDREIPKRIVVDVNINYNPINFMQKAHVVWSKKRSDGTYEHGAEFINVPKERKLLLEDHIKDIQGAIGQHE